MGRLKLLQTPCVIKWKYPSQGCPVVVSREVTEQWKQYNTIAIAVGCSPKLDIKTLILKRPNALVAEYRDITLTLPPPCWLVFIVPEGTIHSAGGKLMSNSLNFAVDPVGNNTGWCNNVYYRDKPTNFWLFWTSTSQEEIHTWYYKPNKSLWLMRS